MTPSQYKARYENLVVALDDGTTTKVRVNQYRLNPVNYNAQANDAFISILRDKLKHKDLDLTLKVSTEKDLADVDAGSTKVEWVRLAQCVFLGKGAPEHCQIVLQLAQHWGLAPDLQKYADSYLGLDCNGFVGNYLWHVKRGRAWTDLGIGNHDLGPEAFIKDYFNGKELLGNWEEIDTSQSYIMGTVDDTGQIIQRGASGKHFAHIIITEPGRRADRPGKDGSKSFAVWSVESTGAHTPGLWESWYTCLGVKNKVFSIDREEMVLGRRYRSFKIAAVN